MEPQNFSVVPLGVDIEPQEKQIIWRDKLRLIYCGHLIRRKRIDRILRLLASLKAELPETNIQLTIVGQGNDARSLQALSDKLGISDSIEWSGFMDRAALLEAISSHDFFVLLSDSEAFGITVAESLSLGTPVLVSDNTALSEFSNLPGCFTVQNPDDALEAAKVIMGTRGKPVVVSTDDGKIRQWSETIHDYFVLFSGLNDNFTLRN